MTSGQGSAQAHRGQEEVRALEFPESFLFGRSLHPAPPRLIQRRGLLLCLSSSPLRSRSRSTSTPCPFAVHPDRSAVLWDPREEEVQLLSCRIRSREKSTRHCVNSGQAVQMAPSFTSRPRSGVGESRPVSRDSENLVIPNRTSSLHSRIVQPMPNTMAQQKPTQRAPKTLTHAYMVCGVGREPSQWVKAPAPAQGKIGHMKGAVGQFWLPEILGSSPRLEQDNEIARSLHSAMRVCAIDISSKEQQRLTFAGVLPTRCRDLHRREPAALRPSCLRASARLFAHSLRHCAPRLVSCGRKARRDDSRAEEAHRVGLLRHTWRNLLDPLLSELPVEVSTLQSTRRLSSWHVDSLEQGNESLPRRRGLSHPQLPSSQAQRSCPH